MFELRVSETGHAQGLLIHLAESPVPNTVGMHEKSGQLFQGQQL